MQCGGESFFGVGSDDAVSIVVNMALSCSKFHKFVDLVQNWFVGLEFSFYL